MKKEAAWKNGNSLCEHEPTKNGWYRGSDVLEICAKCGAERKVDEMSTDGYF